MAVRLIVGIAALVLILVLWHPTKDDSAVETASAAQSTTSAPPSTTAVPPTTLAPPTTTTTARARSAPTMRAASVSPPVLADPPDSDFDRLAECESDGRWDTNTGNGYYGGLQFSASTWSAYGGTDLPHQHSRETQIEVARRLWRARGWQPWPSCSRQLGWR